MFFLAFIKLTFRFFRHSNLPLHSCTAISIAKYRSLLLRQKIEQNYHKTDTFYNLLYEKVSLVIDQFLLYFQLGSTFFQLVFLKRPIVDIFNIKVVNKRIITINENAKKKYSSYP